MRFLLSLALLSGCGSRAPSSAAPPIDSGIPDAPISHDAGTDAPVVYCSSLCGAIDAGTDGAIACAADEICGPCDPGQICGETGGISGFICCAPDACSPGNPAPGTVGCQ